MSLQITATADFGVCSPDHSRVLIGLAETRDVSKESSKVDNEQPLSMYLQLNSLLFFSSLLEQNFYLCQFQFRVTQKKRKHLFFNLNKSRTERALHEFFYQMSRIANII